MTTAGEALEADHRAIDDHFAGFASAAANGTLERDHLAEAVRALRLHIWVEEDLFFPPLRAAGVVGPVLYATADRILDAEMSTEVINGLSADLPAGWTCAMAAR